MLRNNAPIRILIVSSSQKADEYLRGILRAGHFPLVTSAASVSEAKRLYYENHYEIVIVNTPLSDDFGVEFAEQVCENSATGVLLFVKDELYEQISCKVEDSGILTFPKPGTRQTIYQALKLLVAAYRRLEAFERRAVTLETKMKEIRTVNRAKWLLIDRYKMSEEEAHKYIEKTAMDSCVKRVEVAENIIKTYET